MAGNIIDVSDATFQKEVLESDVPVLVDFWATWCAPCRVLAPTVETISQEYNGKVRVAKLNVDENPNTAAKYNIKGIPTLLLFKKGVIKEQIVGVTPKESISKMLENHVTAVQKT